MFTITLPRKTFAKRYEQAAPLWANSALELSMTKVKMSAPCPVSFAHLTITPKGFLIEVKVEAYASDGNDEVRAKSIIEKGIDPGPKNRI